MPQTPLLAQAPRVPLGEGIPDLAAGSKGSRFPTAAMFGQLSDQRIQEIPLRPVDGPGPDPVPNCLVEQRIRLGSALICPRVQPLNNSPACTSTEPVKRAAQAQ